MAAEVLPLPQIESQIVTLIMIPPKVFGIYVKPNMAFCSSKLNKIKKEALS